MGEAGSDGETMRGAGKSPNQRNGDLSRAPETVSALRLSSQRMMKDIMRWDYNLENFPKEKVMKKYRVLLVIALLVFASLACQALSRGGAAPAGSPDSGDANSPSSSQDEGNGAGSSSDLDFPITRDAYNVLDVGDGTLLYYTKMSREDVMKFYRDEYDSRGYTENELLTVVSDGVFSMVFEGDPSGKSIVIQSVDLGDGSRTVTIRLEDV